jgi:hypothetical protein
MSLSRRFASSSSPAYIVFLPTRIGFWYFWREVASNDDVPVSFYSLNEAYLGTEQSSSPALRLL